MVSHWTAGEGGTSDGTTLDSRVLVMVPQWTAGGVVLVMVPQWTAGGGGTSDGITLDSRGGRY